MIDIVAVLFSPKVTPSGLADSGITIVMTNEEFLGSYIASSIMFTVNIVSCPKEESNSTFDDGKLKSATIIKSPTILVAIHLYLPVAVITEEFIWTIKLVVKDLDEITVTFNFLPLVILYLIFINDTYKAV